MYKFTAAEAKQCAKDTYKNELFEKRLANLYEAIHQSALFENLYLIIRAEKCSTGYWNFLVSDKLVTTLMDDGYDVDVYNRPDKDLQYIEIKWS